MLSPKNTEEFVAALYRLHLLALQSRESSLVMIVPPRIPEGMIRGLVAGYCQQLSDKRRIHLSAVRDGVVIVQWFPRQYLALLRKSFNCGSLQLRAIDEFEDRTGSVYQLSVFRRGHIQWRRISKK